MRDWGSVADEEKQGCWRGRCAEWHCSTSGRRDKLVRAPSDVSVLPLPPVTTLLGIGAD